MSPVTKEHPDRGSEPDAPRRGERAAAKSTPAPQVEGASVITALLPATAAVGDPSFMLRVVGSGFDPSSVIVFAGQDEETVFVSTEELTTGMNMPLWQGPDPAIPVLVRTNSVDSNTLLFAMMPAREVPLDPAHASKPSPQIDSI